MLEITIVNFESKVKNCDFEHFEQEWTKASVKIPSEIKLHLISRCFDETFKTPKKARTFHISKYVLQFLPISNSSNGGSKIRIGFCQVVMGIVKSQYNICKISMLVWYV